MIDLKISILKKAVLFLCLLSISGIAFSQNKLNEKKIKPLVVGDKLPDIVLHNMLNYSGKTTKLSDFNKGKLLLLDFWATHCGTCIASFPKLEELESEFAGKFNVLLVTDQSEQIISSFFKMRKARTGKDFEIPNVCADTILKKLFPYSMIPHCVWINDKGIVVSITSGTEVTAKNIQEILDKKPVAARQKSDDDYMELDYYKPLFVQGNGGDGKELLWYTALTGYVDKVIPSRIIKPQEVFVMNMSITQLYRLAYHDKFDLVGLPSSRTILEVADSSKYLEKLAGIYQAQNFYNYQLIAPHPVPLEDLQQFMQTDLKRYFGLEAKYEKRKLKCFVLSAEDTLLIRTNGEKSLISIDQYNVDFKNEDRSYLLYYLNDYLGKYNYPIVDETGLKGNITLKFEADLTNPISINRALSKYKMSLTIAEREIDVLVLREPGRRERKEKASINEIPGNWHLLDKKQDGYYGMGLIKARNELLKNKKPDSIIVAVIDAGLDTLHTDLKQVLWHNPKEIPGNGKDDDGNGYVDDVYGWNFLGGKDPANNVIIESMEYQRFYFKYKGRFNDVTKEKQVKQKDRLLYDQWLRAKTALLNSGQKRLEYARQNQKVLADFPRLDSLFKIILKKDTYTIDDLKLLSEPASELKQDKKQYLSIFGDYMPGFTNNQIAAERASADSIIKFYKPLESLPVNYRANIVKDNYKDITDRYYGNNNVMAGSFAQIKHGTAAAGIISAECPTVKIMSIRAVPPSADEFDKDIALAIRYAVDNGAKIISMSFAKNFSAEQQWVEDAIRYAAKKDVLLLNGAGNSSANLDSLPYYPTSRYLNTKERAPNMITVGWSSPTEESLIHQLSNYGKEMVDVFAPGENIRTTSPRNEYTDFAGTSAATPVVAGLAAVLKSNFPHLTAVQIKNIIEKSVTKVFLPVTRPGTSEKTFLTELCTSGGIVNAYEAVKMAMNNN